MASEETDDKAVVFGDEFVADEILARLPARYAARCTVLSKRFQQLVRSQHFWLRQYRLGTPLELPHAARHQHHRDRNRNVFYIEFHVVGPKFFIEHAVSVEDYTTYAGTCNGLVLVSLFSFSDRCDGVVFNPENVFREIMGFGYGPSTKVYKALIREWVFQDSMRLMVVSLDGSGGQEPRTVFSSNNVMECRDSLHMTDGKVYFLMSAMEFNYERSVLAFDVDTESMIRIATPEGQSISLSMLELQGRPCIYTQKGQDTVIWLLNVDHRWEQLYNLVKESSQWDDHLLGTWDCGDGILFAKYSASGAFLYNLQEAAGEDKEGRGCGTRLAAVSSLKIEYKQPWFCPWNLMDYKTTLLSPASIFGDAAFLGSGCQSVAPKHELDETFLEMTRKGVVDPMMHMLSALEHV
ncbi:hypothetical protein ACQ4PT_033699 [Festuca glaucescens]